MSRKLNQYSSEFKESAVKLALEGDKSVGQTAVDLGIKKSTLYTWVNKYRGPKPLIAKVNDNVSLPEHCVTLYKILVIISACLTF